MAVDVLPDVAMLFVNPEISRFFGRQENPRQIYLWVESS